jgi:hypothetical protein
MCFAYPSAPHQRIHGPIGYSDFQTFKEWLKDEFEFRCVYCLNRERWMPVVEKEVFGVDHILPKSTPSHAHLECEYTNLLYSCNRCNSLKLEAVLIDPCTEAFGRHLRINSDGKINCLTDVGKKIVKKLRLDNPKATRFRRWLLEFHRAISANPDGQTARLFHHLMSYPTDLPDLAKLRPPQNSKPEGIARSHFARRERNELPASY